MATQHVLWETGFVVIASQMVLGDNTIVLLVRQRLVSAAEMIVCDVTKDATRRRSSTWT